MKRFFVLMTSVLMVLCLTSCIEEIWLGIESKNSYSNEGYIWIEYKFSNADEAQDSFDDIL